MLVLEFTNFVGWISYIFVNVNIKDSGAEWSPPSLVHDKEVYPPKIFPFSFLYKQIVGPLLLHLLWKILLSEPSSVPLYNNSHFWHPLHSIIFSKNSSFLLDSLKIILSISILVFTFLISLQAPYKSLFKQHILIS